MTYGPQMIITCPHCQGLSSYQTYASGNTFGATFWTDGKLEAPMLQDPPVVAKCSLCQKCFWLADAPEIGSYYPWNDVDVEVTVPEAWKQAAEIIEPEESDFYQLLQGGLAKDQDQEKTLRILTWWRTNDLFRQELPTKIEDDPDLWPVFKMNLEALSYLLNDKDENDCLMKAELLRELGRYEECKALLTRVKSKEMQSDVQQLRALCDKKECRVRALEVPNE